jgi:hypothetical protein
MPHFKRITNMLSEQCRIKTVVLAHERRTALELRTMRLFHAEPVQIQVDHFVANGFHQTVGPFDQDLGDFDALRLVEAIAGGVLGEVHVELHFICMRQRPPFKRRTRAKLFIGRMKDVGGNVHVLSTPRLITERRLYRISCGLWQRELSLPRAPGPRDRASAGE